MTSRERVFWPCRPAHLWPCVVLLREAVLQILKAESFVFTLGPSAVSLYYTGHPAVTRHPPRGSPPAPRPARVCFSFDLCDPNSSQFQSVHCTHGRRLSLRGVGSVGRET